MIQRSPDCKNEDIKKLNSRLLELSNQFIKKTTPLYKFKKHYPGQIDRIILSYTTLGHAAKQIMAENHNAKKLLDISMVIEKWLIESLQVEQHQPEKHITEENASVIMDLSYNLVNKYQLVQKSYMIL